MNKGTNAQEKEKPNQGLNIRFIREKLGLKQENVAHDLGLSQQSVSNYEQKEELPADMAEKFALYYEVAPKYITDVFLYTKTTSDYFDQQHSQNVMNYPGNVNINDSKEFWSGLATLMSQPIQELNKTHSEHTVDLRNMIDYLRSEIEKRDKRLEQK